MKKLILPFIILIGLAACEKRSISPKYVVGDKYTGDSVRYNFDSLPVPLPAPPEDYSDYNKLIQVYTNNTVTIDYTHIIGQGMSVTYRMFIRYIGDNYVQQGWYRRQISNDYIIPADSEVVIYRTVPYEGPIGPDSGG
ncbi:MAG: hypothetical protein EPN39_04685 [Chitinophagaceae bacterium]|jgi:hypothetical protein|nr:MAG: hypothetical protein EPN39_04685 [Chitinophagaceae bacterium]